MLEQLSAGGIQRLTAELAQGRVETLLRIGQVQVATVVDVVPQPPRQSSAQPQNTTSQVRQSSQATGASADNKPASSSLTYTKGKASSTTNASGQSASPASGRGSTVGNASSGNAGSSTGSVVANPSSSSSSSTNAASTQAFLTRINVEGKLLEIVTPTPLKPGSQITLSRNNQNQLIISSQQSNQAATPSSTTNTSNTSNSPAAQRLPLVPGETTTAKVVQSRPEGASNTSTSNTANTNAPSPRQAATVSNSNTQTSAQPSNTSAAQQAVVRNTTQSTVQTAPQQASQASTQTTGSTQSYVTTINVKGTMVEIATPRPIPAGTELKITLDKAGQVQVQLPAPARLAADQALRENLPIQQPISQLLTLLQDPALSQQIARSQPLLTGLLQLLLGRSLTSPHQTDAQQLRQSLQDGGTQMENKLARQDSQGLRQDSKALLLQLQNRLTNLTQSLPQNAGQRITEMTQQAISRVLVNQLTSLTQQVSETEGDRTRTLVTDIPVSWQQQTENLRIRVTQRQSSEEGDNENAEARWQVQLQFDMPDMPPLQAELTLVGEQVSVLFFGNQQTKSLIHPQLDQLHTALEKAGLEVDLLQVRDKPLDLQQSVKTQTPLIDIKT